MKGISLKKKMNFKRVYSEAYPDLKEKPITFIYEESNDGKNPDRVEEDTRLDC